ncbi:hypothetical protein EDD86DRAFT_182098, partial [Gorgonomyces haynaldii]
LENRRFYIKYLNNQPLKIDIRYAKRPDGGPIEDVGDLVAAYKIAVAPRFNDVPVDQFTLHTS